MDYDETLTALQGFLGTNVHASVSAAEPSSSIVAGFSGVLERGTPQDTPLAATPAEAIVFIVRPTAGGQDGGYFIISPQTFVNAAWAEGNQATELVFRVGGVDVALMPV